MKAYWGVDVWSHIFLTSALVGSEWSASRPCRFNPGVGPRAGLHRTGTPNSDLSVVQPVASRYSDWAIPVVVLLLYCTLQTKYRLRSTLIYHVSDLSSATSDQLPKVTTKYMIMCCLVRAGAPPRTEHVASRWEASSGTANQTGYH
jgi:hypothetical protein